MSIAAPAPIDWRVASRDRKAEHVLQESLGIRSLLAALLVRRGLTDPAAADRFLNPSLDQLHDPTGLPDYRAAADAILGAKERGETIYVHGDYDVDGVTSAALFSRFLSKVGCDVVTHVPHRMKEGYGIHLRAVQDAADAGAKLFLTCDCGSAAHEQIVVARSHGMCVIVTDHHTVSDTPIGAQAFVNVHRPDSTYPFDHLSGVGVVFKLCEGLTAELGMPKEGYYRAFLDLAALGTIADVMPLVGENRILAKFGLERLADTKKIGLQALMREAKLPRGAPLRTTDVSFGLGPRLNAAGRIDDAELALRLLLTVEESEATSIARKIDEVNTERRRAQQEMMDLAIQMVVDSGAHLKNVIVVGHESWHPGIVGIVAGKLVEKFHRPAFVLNVDTESGIGRGSARSIPNFDLSQAIDANREWLVNGGGHAAAAGVSLKLENLTKLTDGLHRFAAETLTEEDLRLSLDVDFEVSGDEVSLDAVREVELMQPFGMDNATPRVVARGLEIEKVVPTQNPLHTILWLRTPELRGIKAPGFHMGERLVDCSAGDRIDVVFAPSVNLWNGRESVEWVLKDYSPSVSG